MVELLVPPGQRLLVRSIGVTQVSRVLVGIATQITAASATQQVSLYNPVSIALLGLVGLRADASILGMLLLEPNVNRVLDLVIDSGQRLSIIGQTQNAALSAAISAKLFPSSFDTDARMAT